MYKIAVILGIRPDFIRTSKVLKLLKEHSEIEATFIHTGQHYDKNLNDIFFGELNIPNPDIQLDTRGKTHCEQHSNLIRQLEPVLLDIKPNICLFLGDANAVIGCIAPLKLGIPIAHIEAGMRSFDWRMPEERNRVIIDRISDVLYVYHENYKINLVREGICPTKIEVVGNVIVDVVNEAWIRGITEWRPMFNLTPKKYALVTMHRNEHINGSIAGNLLWNISDYCQQEKLDFVFVEMPRIKQLGLQYPSNINIIPPQGFFDFIMLENNATIEFTDSGTNQEVAAVLGTPCVVTRHSTERPETFDSNISSLSGHSKSSIRNHADGVRSRARNPSFSLGDGKSSERIVNNLVKRLDRGLDRIPYHDMFIEKHFGILNG